MLAYQPTSSSEWNSSVMRGIWAAERQPVSGLRGLATPALTAVAIIEVSSMIRNMAAATKNKSAASFMPVTHWGPFLAGRTASSEALLETRWCDNSVTEGCGDGCFPPIFHGRVSVARGLDVVENVSCLVGFIADDTSLLDALIFAGECR